MNKSFLKDTIHTMTKEEIGNMVFWLDSPIVVTVIAEVDDHEIWSEAELEAKDVLNWLNELCETCTLKFVHVSNESVNKIWKVE